MLHRCKIVMPMHSLQFKACLFAFAICSLIGCKDQGGQKEIALLENRLRSVESTLRVLADLNTVLSKKVEQHAAVQGALLSRLEETGALSKKDLPGFPWDFSLGRTSGSVRWSSPRNLPGVDPRWIYRLEPIPQAGRPGRRSSAPARGMWAGRALGLLPSRALASRRHR